MPRASWRGFLRLSLMPSPGAGSVSSLSYMAQFPALEEKPERLAGAPTRRSVV
jgi:hypothetical protein